MTYLICLLWRHDPKDDQFHDGTHFKRRCLRCRRFV